MTPKQSFGGTWTEKKLAVLKGYLEAYNFALKGQSWVRERVYIDAFAGTGEREISKGKDANLGETLFPELMEPAPQAFLDGSAKIALEVEPAFHRYVFVERTRWKAQKLNELLRSYPNRKGHVLPEDANPSLRSLASTWHPKDRGVVFLDPFGMALEWSTLKAIADTKAMDVWLLFPLGQAISRMLVGADKQMDSRWDARLTTFFGTEDWRPAFRPQQVQVGLFGPEEVTLRNADYSVIEAFFRKRLSIFPFVHKQSLTMTNERGVPLFLLLFMMATENTKAHRIGNDVASHLFRLHD